MRQFDFTNVEITPEVPDGWHRIKIVEAEVMHELDLELGR